ncbi:MAG: hypothetical protein NTX54_02480 [Chloroflexi bacterium]|nr:hypothetical protein [Chloroflexota bacterium]
MTIDPGPEPVHEADRQRARMERRLAVGGFSILIGVGGSILLVMSGGIAAVVSGVIILGGALVLAGLWFLLSLMEWWANRPSP